MTAGVGEGHLRSPCEDRLLDNDGELAVSVAPSFRVEFLGMPSRLEVRSDLEEDRREVRPRGREHVTQHRVRI